MTSCEYIDKVQNAEKFTEKNNKVTISGEVDRVYKKVQDKVLLEVGDGSSIQIEKSNLKDTGKLSNYSSICINLTSGRIQSSCLESLDRKGQGYGRFWR